LCAELECTHVTGLPGVQHKGVGDKDSLELALDEIRWRQRVAASSGIRYAIKPHVNSICSSVDQARALLDAIPGLTLTLDYGHFVFQKISSRHVHTLVPFASHVHMRGGAPNRLQAPVNESEIDFNGIIRRLNKNQYQGFLAITYLRDASNERDNTDNVSETILLRNRIMENLQPEPEETGQSAGESIAAPIQETWPQSSLANWGT
jgi:sugar phosphate isomerase/epimerase